MQPKLKKILAREIVILFFSAFFIGLVFISLSLWNWKSNGDREKLELAITSAKQELSAQSTANIDFLHGLIKESDLMSKEWSKDKLFEHLNDSVKCRAFYDQVDMSDSLTDMFLDYEDFRKVIDLNNELPAYEKQKSLNAGITSLENELTEVSNSVYTAQQIESICIRLLFITVIVAFAVRYGYYIVIWAFRNFR